jgi:hypothetical protein
MGLENEPTWSKSEETIVRTAFDAALGRERHDVIQEVKRTALEGRLFDKFVEKLSGDQYKHLIQTEPEFEARENGHFFTPQPSIHDVRPKKIGGETWSDDQGRPR